MITQWDIISSIRPKDNALVYALLIDGTEHDARLIAKKLKGYVRQPQPAMAPYVYSFPLPEDLDENTLEKIRVAVREGIEQAKKVNEFIPGGALGNPLFNPQTQQEDKDFPTFITLDPSESFFRSAPNAANSNTAPLPPVDHLERKHIDLGNIEEESPQIPVVIWIIIAFYSQSYTGEDSVGMLGTGLFGVISSMLVGLSMVSDAGIFSLITMINIFTLSVIMIMTYQAIAAKRAQVRKDKVLIAYNGIKLRVLFILLTLCTIAMFVVIPAIAYMWRV